MFSILALLLSSTIALAQGNPTCPTRPAGDNTNACASTAYVQNSLSSGLPLTQNHIYVGSASNLATDVAMSGDATIVASGVITLASTIVAGGPIGSTTTTPIITWDAKGRLLSVSSATIATREIVTGNRTYFVRTDGNDSNTCLTNTAGGACLTIQAALNKALLVDFAGFSCTIQVGAGTYTGGVLMTRSTLGAICTLQGDTTTPSNVVISPTGASAIYVSNDAVLNVAGFKVQTTTSGYGLFAYAEGQIYVTGKMVYGTTADYHISAQHAGVIDAISQQWTISGNATAHLLCQTNGQCHVHDSTVTCTGAPAFSQAFLVATGLGSAYTATMTFPGCGTVTGPRFLIFTNANVDTGSAALTYFPGNSAGTTNTGGLLDGNSGSVTFYGATSGSTILQPSAVSSGTLTLPAATDTLVGKATTDTLTNKSIDAGQLTGTIAAGRMPALTGDVTTSAGTVATTIVNNAVTNAKAAQMTANTVKCNNTGGTANSIDCTVQQAQALLALPYIVLTATGVNFNSANTDTAFTIPTMPTGFTRFRFVTSGGGSISNPSVVITTATFGVFPAAAGAGTAIVATGTATSLTSTAANTNGNAQGMVIVNQVATAYTPGSFTTPNTFYFRVQTAQGSAATADVVFVLQLLP